MILQQDHCCSTLNKKEKTKRRACIIFFMIILIFCVHVMKMENTVDRIYSMERMHSLEMKEWIVKEMIHNIVLAVNHSLSHINTNSAVVPTIDE